MTDILPSKEIHVDLTELTLNKVYEAMHEVGIRGEQAINLVNTIHSKGVLFRERGIW